MKKIIALLLVVVMCLSFVACGKSEEVKAAEAKIAVLSENSSYKEINEAYEIYDALEYDDKEKVENKDILAKYISLGNGSFYLTDNMINEIKAYFKNDTYGLMGLSPLTIEVTASKYTKSYAEDWDRVIDYTFSSEEKTDEYTYTKYGVVKIADKFGKVASYNFIMDCTMKYDAEKDELIVSKSADIKN